MFSIISHKTFVSLCLIVSIFHFRISLSQEKNYVHYTTADGLSSNQVYKMVQDDIGYLWFLTDRGICRYNGYEFENFTKTDGLSDNVFFDFQKMKDGSIWILGSNSTLTKISPDDPEFSHYQFNDTLIAYEHISVPRKFFLREDGDLFLSHFNSYNYLQLSAKGNIKNKAFKIDCDVINVELVLSETNTGGFFYHKNSGNTGDLIPKYSQQYTYSVNANFYAFESRNKKHSVILYNDTIVLRSQGKERLIIEEDCFMGGFLDSSSFWISKKNEGVKFFTIYGKEMGHILKNEFVTNVYQDKEAEFWISTLDNGVFQMKDYLIKYFTDNNLKDQNIYQLTTDNYGNLVIGHFNGNVSYLINGKTISLYKSIIHKPAMVEFLSNGQASEFYFMSDGEIYKGKDKTRVEETFLGNGNGFFDLGNRDIGIYGHFGVGVKSKLEGWIKVSKPHDVNEVVEYRNKLFVASRSGLYQRPSSEYYASFSRTKAFLDRVNALLVFNDVLVVGTHGAGIMGFRNDSILFEINDESISGSYINNLIKEDSSSFWICTNTGLTKVSFSEEEKFTTRIIGVKDGLFDINVHDIEIINDTIWVGTSSGLFYFDRTELQNSIDNQNYNLRIDGLKVNDKVYQIEQLNHFQHHQNKLSFSFLGITFRGNGSLTYRYKLEGLDKNWNYTLNREAVYASLKPGDYVFNVQVKGNNAFWSEPVRMIIKIYPPFWKTWWFIVLTCILVIGLIYLFFRLKILLYNRDLTREILRQVIKRLKRKSTAILVREGSKEVKILSNDINYIKSDGNYLEIHHSKGKTVIRHKIGQFLELVPDPIEYIQIRRSYIIRIDKIDQLGRDFVMVANQKIKVGSTYQEEFKKIQI